MSDISEILRRRKFGEDIIEKLPETKPVIYPIQEEVISQHTEQNNQSLSTIITKDEILSTNNLDNLVKSIKYLDTQATYAFFYLSHCFLKIRNDKLYTQKGYTNFTDFIDKELTDYSMRQVYNYIGMAETFDINTSTNVLALGSTKLGEIAKIKKRSERFKFLEKNLEEIKNMSTRELRIKIIEMNQDFLLNNKNKDEYYIKQWKELTTKFNLFLDDVNLDNLENDKINIMRVKLNEIEEKIKSMQNKLNDKCAIDCKNDKNE